MMKHTLGISAVPCKRFSYELMNCSQISSLKSLENSFQHSPGISMITMFIDEIER